MKVFEFLFIIYRHCLISERRKKSGYQQQPLKPTQRQCCEAANKANHVLFQLSKAYHYRDRRTFVQFYKQYVCPTAFRVCSAGLIALDKAILGNVQRKVVRNAWSPVCCPTTTKIDPSELSNVRSRRKAVRRHRALLLSLFMCKPFFLSSKRLMSK